MYGSKIGYGIFKNMLYNGYVRFLVSLCFSGVHFVGWRVKGCSERGKVALHC